MCPVQVSEKSRPASEFHADRINTLESVPVVTAVEAFLGKRRSQFVVAAFALNDFAIELGVFVVQTLSLVSNADENPLSFTTDAYPFPLKIENISSSATGSRSYLEGYFVSNPA